MISIKFHGILTKEWWIRKRRENFVKNEIKPGRILVTWVDVDNTVYGWNMSADDEMGLGLVAIKIASVKHNKLMEIIGKGELKNHG